MGYNSQEEVYVDLEGISEQAKVLRDLHGYLSFPGRVPPPPYVGGGCTVAVRMTAVQPSEIYRALLELKQRVEDIAANYAAYNNLLP